MASRRGVASSRSVASHRDAATGVRRRRREGAPRRGAVRQPGAAPYPRGVTTAASTADRRADEAGTPLGSIPGHPDLPSTPQSGLDDAEVQRRRAAGHGNAPPPPTTRTYVQILRENIFTFVNNILFALGIALVAVGRPFDALVSLAVISTNVIVGIVQEIRAKRTLDRVALLTRPTATVVRSGEAMELRPEDLVLGDLVAVKAGDQIVLDGRLVAGAITVDESQLTGRERRRSQARRRRRVQRQLRDDRHRPLRRRDRRVGQLRQPDHRRRPVLPTDRHAAAGRDQPRHPGRARPRALPRGAARRPRHRPGVGVGRRHRRRDAAGRPRAQRPVRLDRRGLRPRRDPDPAVRGAGAAGELDRVAQPRRRPVPRQDRHADRQPARGPVGRRDSPAPRRTRS